MDIIMIRHGESEDNVSGVFGTYESPLSKKGIEQIKITKENLREFEFSKVYYSPYARTVETLKHLELQGTPDNRIGEYNFGIFSGKTNAIIEEEFPVEYAEWIHDPNNYIIREGESLRIVYNRVKEFLDEMVQKDQDVVLVSHAGVIRLALCWIFDDIDYFFRFKVDNGSISIISVDDGYKFIKKLNYSPRLK
ncbi:MAG: histidine phosphatase family protein [Tissierella sp.]|nr:histidine phosphatase family protein [Tissierella sp.]